MKAGRSLAELIDLFEAQVAMKRDYMADTRKLELKLDSSCRPVGDKPTIILQGVNGGMPLRSIAHQQLASTLGIPKPYYDRMLKDAPDLLCRNVNNWFEREPSKRLVRTLDGQVRAILSDSYRPLDNLDLAAAALPQLRKLDAEVLSAQVTEERFYLKATTPRINSVVAVDDVVQAGIVLSNSEVGMGSLRVEALDYRLVCLNGMIREKAIRKAHLGRMGSRGADAIEDASEFFTDATRAADDKAFFMKVNDAVRSMFDPERFNVRALQYVKAVETTLPTNSNPVEVVEVTCKRLKLTESEKVGMLRHFLGGPMTKWGLANAVTRTAEDCESYDRATTLEALGGEVIDMGPADWRKLVSAVGEGSVV